jgi:hypothetical protein
LFIGSHTQKRRGNCRFSDIRESDVALAKNHWTTDVLMTRAFAACGPQFQSPARLNSRQGGDMNTGATSSDRGVAFKGTRPSLFLLVSEVQAVAELSAMLATLPALLRAPRGDGHPVLVIPGFLAGDLSTLPLRRLCVPKTLNPTIVVMKSAQDGA